MLSLLILRLACLTLQIIQRNTTLIILLYCIWCWDTSYERAVMWRSRGMLTTNTFILTKLTIPQSSWLCFVLDWTPIGATLICSSGTCDHLQPEWLILTLNTVSVPLLFLREERSHGDRPSRCHFQMPVAVNGRCPSAEQEAVKRSERLACSSKHPLSVRGPSKGQYAVTSQKLDSWLDATRSKWRQRGARSCLSFVTISLYPAPLISLSRFLIKHSIFHFILCHLSWCCCAPPFRLFHF